MQVGITHLAAENPGILEDGAQLQLWVLPLSRTSLESKVFLLREFWPRFQRNQTAAIAVQGLRWVVAARPTLSVQ